MCINMLPNLLTQGLASLKHGILQLLMICHQPTGDAILALRLEDEHFGPQLAEDGAVNGANVGVLAVAFMWIGYGIVATDATDCIFIGHL
jgi:hypothetical protein